MKLNNEKLLTELSKNEMIQTNGGVKIIVITGVLDGIKHNTHMYIFGHKIF